MTKLIKFEKQGCTPCEMVQNYLDEKSVEALKINAFDNPEMSARYDISSVPTLILFDDEGNELGRTIGFKPDEIEELIEQL